jgi:hypothetical protein
VKKQRPAEERAFAFAPKEYSNVGFANPTLRAKCRAKDGAPEHITLIRILLLELVPEELVVDLVVELDFRGLDEGSEQAGAAIG